MKKFLIKALLFLFLVFGIVIVYILLASNKKFDAPLPDIKASSDSAVIARGRYLVFGAAHCAACHIPFEKLREVEAGGIVPLSGGWEISIPPGTFRAPNITPDPETGIGKVSDGELARALRHMVAPDGRMMMSFMPFQEMSDEDLQAVISYLRSQEPVKNKIKAQSLSFLGKALMAFGVLKPEGPKKEVPKSVEADTSASYGEYLAYSVANCYGCHTERDMKTGEFIGKPFAGGFKLTADAFTSGYSFITPNITTDPETGRLANWSEEAFIARFRAGRVIEHSPMPWGMYSRLNETDLKALYRFLVSVEPVKKKIEKSVFEPGEPLP